MIPPRRGVAEYNFVHGHAVAQATSTRFFHLGVLCSRRTSCGVYGVQSGADTGLSPTCCVTSVCQYHSVCVCALFTCHPEDGQWTQLHSLMYFQVGQLSLYSENATGWRNNGSEFDSLRQESFHFSRVSMPALASPSLLSN